MRENEFINHLILLNQASGVPLYYSRGEEAWIIPLSIEKENCPFCSHPRLTSGILDRAACEPLIIADEECPAILYGVIADTMRGAVIVGPASQKPLTIAELGSYEKRNHIADRKNFSIARTSVFRFSAILCEVSLLITGKVFSAKKIQQNFLYRIYAAGKPEIPSLKNEMIGEEEIRPHFPYQFEESMMKRLEAGDDSDAEQVIFSPEEYSSGKLAFKELKNEEYKLVGDISIFCRAAIRGGMNPYWAYDVGQKYLQMTSLSTTLEQYRKIRLECFREYCSEVRLSKASHENNIHVEKCKYYIARHYNKQISYDKMAAYVGVSKSYLSRIFRQSEKMTISEYIQCERIDRAKNMIRFSDYSFSQIASYLCFTDQSHFCLTFKKFAGMTPTEYRKQFQAEGFEPLPE